jgi:uncharacterized membrane protein
LSIFGTLYLTFTPVGKNIIEGVQGRYFLPLAAPLVMGVAAFVPIRIQMSERATKNIFTTLVGVMLLVAVVYYTKATY